MRYNVLVSATVHHVVEAESEQDALAQAYDWVGDEYGNLCDKATFEAVKL